MPSTNTTSTDSSCVSYTTELLQYSFSPAYVKPISNGRVAILVLCNPPILLLWLLWPWCRDCSVSSRLLFVFFSLSNRCIGSVRFSVESWLRSFTIGSWTLTPTWDVSRSAAPVITGTHPPMKKILELKWGRCQLMIKMLMNEVALPSLHASHEWRYLSVINCYSACCTNHPFSSSCFSLFFFRL